MTWRATPMDLEILHAVVNAYIGGEGTYTDRIKDVVSGLRTAGLSIPTRANRLRADRIPLNPDVARVGINNKRGR